MDLHYDSEGSGLGSLYLRDIRHHGIALSHSVPVPITTLDELARKYALHTIDYVKLDLEGHELEALKGASQLLQSHKIKALTFEFGAILILERTSKIFGSFSLTVMATPFTVSSPGVACCDSTIIPSLWKGLTGKTFSLAHQE